MTYVAAYVGALISFLALDAIWLGVVTKSYYRAEIGHLMADKPNFIAAGVFYLFYIAGVVVLAVSPALDRGSWSTAAVLGAVLGFVAYGTYDMTNLAVMRDWPLGMTVVDIVWGTFLTATAATCGFVAGRMFS